MSETLRSDTKSLEKFCNYYRNFDGGVMTLLKWINLQQASPHRALPLVILDMRAIIKKFNNLDCEGLRINMEDAEVLGNLVFENYVKPGIKDA